MFREIFKSLSYITILAAISIPVFSNTANAQESTAIEEAVMETEAAVEAIASEENISEASKAPSGNNITHANHHPEVFIVPLGGEMNLKVRYNHPMDFDGNNYIETIKMEKLDGSFLGLKQFHAKSNEAFAEFLVNPTLADFDQVVLIGKSSKLGEIRSVQQLEFTPEDALPDEFNPKKRREMAMKALREKNAKNKDATSKAEKKAVKKSVKKETKKVVEAAAEVAEPAAEEPKKKKKWGLF